MKYMVGMNQAGYLPIDDDPPMFDTWAEAWEYFQSYARQWAEESDDLYAEVDCGHSSEDEHTDECSGDDLTTVNSALADAHISEATDPNGYGFTVNANDGITYSLWFRLTEEGQEDSYQQQHSYKNTYGYNTDYEGAFPVE